VQVNQSNHYPIDEIELMMTGPAQAKLARLVVDDGWLRCQIYTKEIKVTKCGQQHNNKNSKQV
jgi:hypothetical protein